MSDADVRLLDTPEPVRLVADPLRLRLLEAPRRAPRTVTDLATDPPDAPRRLCEWPIGLHPVLPPAGTSNVPATEAPGPDGDPS